MYIISAFMAFLLSCPANIPQLLVTIIAAITMVGYHLRVNRCEITLSKKHFVFASLFSGCMGYEFCLQWLPSKLVGTIADGLHVTSNILVIVAMVILAVGSVYFFAVSAASILKMLRMVPACYRSLMNSKRFDRALKAALIISVVIRILLLPSANNSDYLNYLYPWTEQYKQLGFIDGLGTSIGNYYVPYNIILAVISLLPIPAWLGIGLVSCAAEYISAYFVYKIAKKLISNESPDFTRRVAQFAAIVSLYLPIVMMDGALWKQCDAVYSCVLMISIYYFIQERYTKSFVFLGLGFSFKLQAIFLIPAYGILYIAKRRYSIFQFMMVPIMYIVTGLPAILCGRGILDTYSVYFKQTDTYSIITLFSPNIWGFDVFSIGTKYYDILSKVGIILTACVLVGYMVWVARNQTALTSAKILYFCGLIIWTCTMFLPAMHERYDYLAIILITVYAIVVDQSKLDIAVALNLSSAAMYADFLFNFTIAIPVGSIIYCFAYYRAVCHFFRETKARTTVSRSCVD